MAKSQQQAANSKKRIRPTSTTSLGKRRRRDSTAASTSPGGPNNMTSSPKSSEYGSQATPFSRVSTPKDLVKVTILGAAGGIGQPLSMLLMLHAEYIQHLALHDLIDSVHGVGLDLSHVDRQVQVTTHLGPDGLADAVKNARVIIIPAGLAQKPGMTRDDLFASNAEIMLNIAKTCAQVAPEAMLAIITNPVNSLVPLACEVYARLCGNKSHHPQSTQLPAAQNQTQAHHQPTTSGAAAAAATVSTRDASPPPQHAAKDHRQPPQTQQALASVKSEGKQHADNKPPPTTAHVFEDCFRRIFGVTTLDVVRASTLTAKSALFKNEPNGLFVDPGKIQVPVVGGHAGKTIIPLLSQATPKLDRKKLLEDKATTSTLIESIQQAGIEVLNAKRGRGSATLAMAYAACRFTISLLRAQSGEQNVIECAYVRHERPCFADLEYFSTPLLLGKDGYVKSMGLGKPLEFEKQMLEEGGRELKLSIARGEDFARERLSADK